MNRSPWLTQLNKNRKITSVNHNLNADVAVVGAGISGLTTAYYILKNNPKTRLILLEGNTLASGASGHNAGQVSAYLEEPIFKLKEKFGEKMAANAQEIFPFAWLELRQILKNIDIENALEVCDGWAYLNDEKQLHYHLKNAEICSKNGTFYDTIYLHENYKNLAKNYKEIVKILNDQEFAKYQAPAGTIAFLKSQKGCVNSALVCEKILEFLQFNFKENFWFFENSLVKEIDLKNDPILTIKDFKIEVKNVVLCTNGFRKLNIVNGDLANNYLKENSKGLIGYMKASLMDGKTLATAYSFYENDLQSANDQEVYYYVTRRNFGQNQHLLCVGGPEAMLGDKDYDFNHDAKLHYENLSRFMDEKLNIKQDFLQNNQSSNQQFSWHGLMGFTKNGVRLIGADVGHKNLLYNIGCNGVGILTSVYGSWKIGQLLNGAIFEKTVFDPE